MTCRFHLNSLICRPYNTRISTHLSKRSHTPRLYDIETEAGFTLEGLLQTRGCRELQALGLGKHGDGPPAEEAR
jgi:hypothetical protein